MYQYHFSVMTHPGCRPKGNEDNFYINGFYKKDPDAQIAHQDGTISEGYVLASVCDGMGGQCLGEVASMIAVETLNEFFGKKPQNLSVEWIQTLIDEANRRVCRKMTEEKKRMGSTLSMVEIVNDKVIAANLGDSRIYRFRNGGLLQLSTDHTTVARLLRTGAITKEEAKMHPMRHQISQYLGIFPKEMILEPAVTEISNIEDQDIYLLCSDGLTDMLEEDEITAVLAAEKNITNAAKMLIEKANLAGGEDNITVVLVRAEALEYKKNLFSLLRDKLYKGE